MAINSRNFYTLGLAPESRIGSALEADGLFGNTDSISFYTGKKIHALPSDVSVSVKLQPGKHTKANVIANGFGWQIIGLNLATCIKDICGDDVELLEVPIQTVDAVPIKSQFFALNVLRMLDVLSDKETVRFPNSKSILKLAIVASRVPADTHIFLIKSAPFSIIVDEFLKNTISDLPHDGLVFIPVAREMILSTADQLPTEGKAKSDPRKQRTFFCLGFGETIKEDGSDLGDFDYLAVSETQQDGPKPAPGSQAARSNPGCDVVGDVIVNPSLHCMSYDLANCLKEIGKEDISTYELPIHTKEGVLVEKKFFNVKCLRVLDALSVKKNSDFPSATFGSVPEPCFSILNSKLPEDVHVFRVLNLSYYLFVDNLVRTELSKFPHRGLSFVPVNSE